MTNKEAVEVLESFAESAGRAVRAATWAQAYLFEGGEATWDAVKSVSLAAELLSEQADRVVELRDRFEEILP